MVVGWHVIPAFKISLHVKDRALLESIQRSLGVGNIYKHGKNSLELRVSGLKNLSVLIKHLDSYPSGGCPATCKASGGAGSPQIS